MTPEGLSGLLSLVEAVRALLRTVEQTGQEGVVDHGVLLARLAALPSAGAARGRPAASPLPVAAPSREDDRLGELLVAAGAAHADDVVVAVLEQELAGDERRIGDILLDQGAVAPDDLDDVLRVQAEGRRTVATQAPGVPTVLHDALTALAAEHGPGRRSRARGRGATQQDVGRDGAGPVLLVRLGQRAARGPAAAAGHPGGRRRGRRAVRVGSGRGRAVPRRGPAARPAVRSGAGPPRPPPEDVLHLVVCSHDGRSVGLVVDEVLAVVDEAVAVRPPTSPACSA